MTKLYTRDEIFTIISQSLKDIDKSAADMLNRRSESSRDWYADVGEFSPEDERELARKQNKIAFSSYDNPNKQLFRILDSMGVPDLACQLEEKLGVKGLANAIDQDIDMNSTLGQLADVTMAYLQEKGHSAKRDPAISPKKVSQKGTNRTRASD